MSRRAKRPSRPALKRLFARCTTAVAATAMGNGKKIANAGSSNVPSPNPVKSVRSAATAAATLTHTNSMSSLRRCAGGDPCALPRAERGMVPSGVVAIPLPSRRMWALLAIPILFGIVACVAPSRQYHWDTLERAYLLEHPARYLRTWDGSPRSQFLSFAHVLELPLAAVVRAVMPGASGLRALCVFEILVAVALLWLFGWLVRWWRERCSNGLPRDA